MKKEILGIASELENFAAEVKNIKNNSQYSDSFKQDKIEEKEQEFKGFAEENFKKAANKLNRQAEQAKAKLQELQGKEYDKRDYYSDRAFNELNFYDEPAEYFKHKQAKAEGVELLEARKAALSKARATDQAKYEELKGQVINSMNDEELEARKELAKTEIQRQNLEGAKNSFNYDFDNIKKGETDTAKTSLIAYSETDNINSKAKKKLSETF